MQGLNDLDPNAQGRDLHRRVATCAAKHLLDKELCINSRSMSGVLVSEDLNTQTWAISPNRGIHALHVTRRLRQAHPNSLAGLICTVAIAAPGCSAVCVLGMAWRCVGEPHRAVLVVDHVADAAATSDLVFPLLQVAAVVPVRGQVAAETVLAVVAGSRARVGS